VTRLPAAFSRTAETCAPYFVSSRAGLADERLRALDLDVEQRFDPQRVGHADFLHILNKLNELTFGPVGMHMPRWVFYDCAAVPGGLFGFTRPAADIAPWVREALEVPEGYTGPVPLSMATVIPMIEPGHWHTVSLCSVNEISSGAGPANLRLLSVAGAIDALDIETLWGVSQWRSPDLHTLARFAPLELVTAYTPAHTNPRSLTWRFSAGEGRVGRALVGQPPRPEGTRMIDADDEATLHALQDDIEAGRRVHLVGAPVTEGAVVRVPIIVDDGGAA
jgi:hypothetical protein